MTNFFAWLVIAVLALGCSDNDDSDSPAPEAASGGLGGSAGQGGAGASGSSGEPLGGASGATGGTGGSGGTDDAGAGGAAAGGGEPEGDTKLEACRRYYTAFCKRYGECGLLPGLECEVRVELCPDRLFSEGSLWTVERANACAPEWESFDCNIAATGIGPDCDDQIGTRAEGESCIIGNQCASGACSAIYMYQQTCGTCLPVAENGGACSGSVACPRGQSCDETGQCADVLLTAPEPVPPVGLGGTCTWFASCMPGLGCLAPGEETEEGTCVALPGAGQPCVETFGSAGLCEEGATCDGRPGGTCIPLRQLNEECGFSSCVPELYCNVLADSEVFGVSHTCLAPRQAGDPCPRDYPFGIQTSPCAPGLECLYTSDARTEAFCATPHDLGESCDGHLVMCRPGTQCSRGTCVPIEDRGFFAATCSP